MTAIIAIAALVGLVWGGILLARGSLLLWCVAFLVATCCFGYHLFTSALGPLPITIDRIAAGVAVLAYIVQRRLGRADPKPFMRADWLLVAFTTLLILSTLSVDFLAAKPGLMPPAMRLLVGYLIPVSIYWVARQASLTERDLKVAYTALIAFGIYLSVTAILEVTQQWSLVFPKYIADPELGLHFGRARGPMVHSVSLGLYLGIICLCAWTWWPRISRGAQLFVIALSPLFLAATFVTYTRSAWMGLALGALILAALVLQGRVRIVLFGGVVAACALLAVTKLDDFMGFEREHTASDTRNSVSMRGSFTYVSWKMFLDRPILGFCFGEFYRQKLAYLSDRTTDLELEEIREWVHHNTLLSLLTELGIVGLALFLSVMFLWARYALQVWRDPRSEAFVRGHAIFFLAVLGVYVCPLVFHELSYASADNAIVFMMAGITVGLYSKSRSTLSLSDSGRGASVFSSGGVRASVAQVTA